MPTNILMPALSPTMEEGGLTKWLVKVGDHVAAGDVIAEIETDKATMEVEAVDDGRVARLLVPAGAEGVRVNTVIAVLAGDDEDDSVAKETAEPVANALPPAEPAVSGAPTRRSAAKPGREKTAPKRSPPGDGTEDARVLASPLARRLAKEAGLDLASVKGSGPHGRIVEADIVALGTPVEGAQASVSGAATPGAAKTDEDGSVELVPHDKMRRIIARRLTEAKQNVPHFYLTVDLEIDALVRLRSEINAAAPMLEGKSTYRISVNDLILKALALSLMEVPEANVIWTEEGLLRYKRADIGLAVAVPTGGLITPVVRSANTKRLSDISNEIKDLVTRARERKLAPEEYRGGTTTVTNLGMHDVRQFGAIINPPQSSILAVGSSQQRAVVKKGEVAVATMMTVTLSTDHRAIDGVLAAEFLKAFRRHIEKPAGMLV